MKKITIFLLLVIIGLIGYIFYQQNSKSVIGGCSLFNKVLNNCHINYGGDKTPCIGNQCSDFKINENDSSEKALTYTSDIGNIMSETEALSIAEKSECNDAGTFTGESYFNQNSGGLVSLNMETDKQGCGLRCDVSIDNKTATIGWMCTGLPKMTEKDWERYNKTPVYEPKNNNQVCCKGSRAVPPGYNGTTYEQMSKSDCSEKIEKSDREKIPGSSSYSIVENSFCS